MEMLSEMIASIREMTVSVIGSASTESPDTHPDAIGRFLERTGAWLADDGECMKPVPLPVVSR